MSMVHDSIEEAEMTYGAIKGILKAGPRDQQSRQPNLPHLLVK